MFLAYNVQDVIWRVGGVVTQQSAKLFTPVQIWYAPPSTLKKVCISKSL